MTSENIFKVGIGINYWDDVEGLLRILTNDDVYDFVDKIFVIDGRYEGRKDEPKCHPTYLKDLLGIYSKLEVYDMDNRKQIDKRNLYWHLANISKMDYMIVLDSDEYLQIEPKTLNRTLRTLIDKPEQCYPILQHMEGVVSASRPRLFKAPFNFGHIQSTKPNTISHGSLYTPEGVELINQMYKWFDNNPQFSVNDNEQGGIPGIKMFHDKTFRSRDRVIADRVYYDEVKDR